jgi:hypothetical protein
MFYDTSDLSIFESRTERHALAGQRSGEFVFARRAFSAPFKFRGVRISLFGRSRGGAGMKTLPKVAAEMALSVLAYNLTRVINILGTRPLIAAIRA